MSSSHTGAGTGQAGTATDGGAEDLPESPVGGSSATGTSSDASGISNSTSTNAANSTVDLTGESTSPSSSGGDKSSEPSETPDIFFVYDEKCAEEWASISTSKYARGKSYVYDYCHQIYLNGKINDEKMKKLLADSLALRKVESGKYFLCTLCKEDGKSLDNCLRLMKPGDTSNANTHLKELHQKRINEINAAKDNARKRKSEENEEAMERVKKQSSLPFKKSKSSPKEDKIRKFYQLQFKFVNNKGLPDSTILDKNFRDMIDFCIDNAKYLQGLQHMGTRRFITIQCSSFNEFVSKVISVVAEVRKWYIKKTGKRQRFICVAHDVWDGKRKQINGLSIFFIHPESMDMYRIPVALTPPIGKKAIELSKTCMHGLERIDVEVDDLFRAINDNTTPAVKAGRLLVGGVDETMENRAEHILDGGCDMHWANLFAGLALSLVARRSGGKIINYWAPFQDLYKKLKEAAKFVCDKKNKRWDQYEKTLKDIRQPVIMITLPNGTRVAGALLIFQDMLRSMYALRYYATRCVAFDAKNLNRQQWGQIAQFEAVMRKAMVLCFAVQGDRPEITAETVLLLTHLSVEYEEEDEYEVVDVNDESKQWSASTSFNELPRITMTTNEAKAESKNMPLMTKDSIKLVKRYVRRNSTVSWYPARNSNPNLLLSFPPLAV